MILSHNPNVLTVYSAKELLQVYQSVHQQLTSYKQAFVALLEWMYEHFKKEALYIQNHTLLDKKRKATKESLQQKLKKSYRDFTFHLSLMHDLKQQHENNETNPDYFHFQQLQEKLKKELPKDISIDALFKQLQDSPLQLRTSLVKAKQQLQKRLDIFHMFSRSYPSYEDFFTEALTLNEQKRKLLSLLAQYAALFHNNNEKRVFSPVEFQALISHVNHELSSSQIAIIHGLIPQGLHYMVYDFYLVSEIVWHHVAYQPAPNLLWTYIDCPLEKECLQVHEHQHLLYTLSLLHDPLPIATTFQKIELSQVDAHSYERLLSQMIHHLKRSNELETLLGSFIRLLNMLRLYMSIIKTLFSDRLRNNQQQFEQLWFSQVTDRTVIIYAQGVLQGHSFSAARATYGELYEKTLLAITTSLASMGSLFSDNMFAK